MKLKNRAKITVSSMLLAVGAAMFSGLVPGFGIASAIGVATGIVSIAVPLAIAAVAGLVVGGIVAAGMHYLGKNDSDNIPDLGDSPLATGVLSTLLAAAVLAVPAMIVGTLFPPLIPVIALVGVITLGVTLALSYRATQNELLTPNMNVYQDFVSGGPRVEARKSQGLDNNQDLELSKLSDKSNQATIISTNDDDETNMNTVSPDSGVS